MIGVNCKMCGKRFKTYESRILDGKGKYCSRKCKYMFNMLDKIKCINCNREFQPISWKTKFCSQKCTHMYFRGEMSPKWKERIRLKCKNCEKPFYFKKHIKNETNGKFCSKKCLFEYRVGENSSNWRGGITPQTALRVTNWSWRKKSNEIKKRDNYTCQICGAFKKSWMNVHHIVPYKISQNDNPENLITLCRSCHSKEERKIAV